MSVRRISEKELDQAFAEVFIANHEFRIWVLKGGRFSRHAHDFKLLDRELSKARGLPDYWWRHCWCPLPDGSQSETDVFFVLEADSVRFAIHFENKPPDGKLTMRQAAGYRRRAAFMTNDERWLQHSDFETVLLAPQAFIEQNKAESSQFDRSMSYEEVANFVPLFSSALSH
ncbi:hypothetical protein [Altererythrobacter sp. MF3-039]|uniref:hypothetical protein n=1 Tax=Altererythrobacter sp. MF3-039 TaxID=3252901 RepID=UPI00390CC95F